MKKIYILLVAIFAISSTSCSDYLDSDYIFEDRETIDKVFTDYKKTEQWLAQAYTYLLGQCCDVASKRNTPFVFDDCMYYGDDDVTVDATKGGALSYNKFREGAYDENTFQDTWNRCYNGIRQASIFIQYADMSIEHSAEEIIDLKAQARFVRAYYYWLLLRKYGPIPLVPDEGFDYNQSYEDLELPRNTYDECVDYIAKEMVLAAQGLPLKRDQLSITRPTRGAALATRALAMLYAASPLMNGNDDAYAQQMTNRDGKRLLNPVYDNSKWAKAAAACKDVMGLGVYHIYTADFRSTHSIAFPATIAPPIHPEYSYKKFPEGWQNIDPFESYRSLFNGQVTAMDNPELIFTRGKNISGERIKDMVIHQLPTVAKGWNTHGATMKQVDAYYMSDGTDCPGMNSEYAGTPAYQGRIDTRPRATGYTTNNTDHKPLPNGVSLQYAEREPRFYASIAYNGMYWHLGNEPEVQNQDQQVFYYRGDGNGYANSMFWLRTGIGVAKYVHPDDTYYNSDAAKVKDKDEPAIRYADILLMYAEASLEAGDKPTAIEYLDMVRTRGDNMPSINDTYPQGITENQLREIIRRDRRIELAFEDKRWWDILRWKICDGENGVMNKPIGGMKIEDTNGDGVWEYNYHEVGKRTFLPRMYYQPIPQYVIDKNPVIREQNGGEDGWVNGQNPGY